MDALCRREGHIHLAGVKVPVKNQIVDELGDFSDKTAFHILQSIVYILTKYPFEFSILTQYMSRQF